MRIEKLNKAAAAFKAVLEQLDEEFPTEQMDTCTLYLAEEIDVWVSNFSAEADTFNEEL